jgi:hypothetical protein
MVGCWPGDDVGDGDGALLGPGPGMDGAALDAPPQAAAETDTDIRHAAAHNALVVIFTSLPIIYRR